MEQKTTVIAFGPFRLLPTQRQLWKKEKLVELRPMPLAVLTYLAQHPERVVSVEELHKAVWGSTYVSRTTIRVCVWEVRQALGEEAATARYIETVGRQGYCFIAPLSTPPPVSSFEFQVSSSEVEGRGRRLTTDNWQLTTPFVGRERELTQLQQWFAQAQQGQRQVVLVSGEPGIGKTTLVEAFLQRLESRVQSLESEDQKPLLSKVRTLDPRHQTLDTRVWVGRGQCVESYGPGEAYLPVLEALGRLGRELGTGKLTAVLYQHAPTWLAQLPGVVDIATRGELHRQVAGATQERMLRELCDALEVLTATQPLLLVLEDLQWSDTATLAWLAAVARRPDPVRLFIIGAYRPIDVVAQPHPLRSLVQELRTHRLCREVRLELLSVDEVQEYVRQRFPSSTAADELGLHLYKRTDGNPLFLTASVDALIQQGVVGQEGDRWVVHGDLAALDETVPEDLQHLITKQFEALAAEEQQMLEVASASGLSFSTAEIAVGCNQKLETIESRCEQLARRGQLIEEAGVTEWPDGTLTMSYHFRHALYQQVVYTRLGGGQKVRLHRLVGERKEAGYGERASEIASELAVHFTQGRDRRAVHYRRQAAEHALRHNAYQEVYLHGAAGLALLNPLPDTPERKQLELSLRQLASTALTAIRKVTDEELEAHLHRAQQLCRELEDDTTLVSVLVGLGRLYHVRADRAAIAELEQEENCLIERVQDATLLVQLHTHLTTIATFRGLHARAADHYQQVLEQYDPQTHPLLLSSFGGDPFVAAASASGLSVSLAGRLEQGWSRVAQALWHAEKFNQPFALVNGLLYATLVQLLRGDYDEAEQLARKMAALTHEYHFARYRMISVLLQGSVAVQRGALADGIAAITTALSQYRAIGAQLNVPFFLSFLAEGYRRQGKLDKALQVVKEALDLTATNLDVFWEAELYRLKGELTLAHSSVQRLESRVKKGSKTKSDIPQSAIHIPQSKVEACFQQAIDIACQQGAKSLELRAVMSLARLWQQQGKHHEARNALSEIYHWFTEGFDTQDLREAKALLKEWEKERRKYETAHSGE